MLTNKLYIVNIIKYRISLELDGRQLYKTKFLPK